MHLFLLKILHLDPRGLQMRFKVMSSRLEFVENCILFMASLFSAAKPAHQGRVLGQHRFQLSLINQSVVNGFFQSFVGLSMQPLLTAELELEGANFRLLLTTLGTRWM